MKDKFIRVISPVTLSVIIIIDAVVAAFAVSAIKKIAAQITFYTVFFVLIEAFSIVTMFFVTKETVSNGVKFKKDSLEFTTLDENNIYYYTDITCVKSSKDTKASLRKNFIDRYSHITLQMKDGSISNISLGLTTSKTLFKITEEIEKRLKNK